MKNPDRPVTSAGGKVIPEFLLRYDFPEEMCWSESVQHVLMSPNGYDHEPDARRLPRSQFLDEAWQAKPGPYFAYYGWLSRKKHEPICLLYDGVRYVTVDYAGLFADLCGRVNHVMGLPSDAPCPILPLRIPGETGWCAPPYIVYHDRKNSRATLRPYSMLHAGPYKPWMLGESDQDGQRQLPRPNVLRSSCRRACAAVTSRGWLRNIVSIPVP